MFKKLEVPLYGFEYSLYVNHKDTKVPKAYKDVIDYVDEQFSNETNGLVCWSQSSEGSVIAFNDPEGEGVCFSCIAHECCHLAFWICGLYGIEVREGEKNEAYCYIISNLVSTIAKELLE